MSSYPTIVLDDDGEGGQWHIDENRVTVISETCTTVFTLPKGQRRISLLRTGHGRGQLSIGGFKALTVTVVGPLAAVNRLRDAVL